MPVTPDALAAQAVAGCGHTGPPRWPCEFGACVPCIAAAIRAGIAGALTLDTTEAVYLFLRAMPLPPYEVGSEWAQWAQGFLAALRARAGL